MVCHVSRQESSGSAIHGAAMKEFEETVGHGAIWSKLGRATAQDMGLMDKRYCHYDSL